MEEVDDLLRELDLTAMKLEELDWKIRLANATNKVSNGDPMVETLARRDALIAMEKVINNLIATLVEDRRAYFGDEDIRRRIVKIDVPTVSKHLDDLAKKIREVDVLIQKAEWTITV